MGSVFDRIGSPADKDDRTGDADEGKDCGHAASIVAPVVFARTTVISSLTKSRFLAFFTSSSAAS